jgi:hypothetical protein
VPFATIVRPPPQLGPLMPALLKPAPVASALSFVRAEAAQPPYSLICTSSSRIGVLETVIRPVDGVSIFMTANITDAIATAAQT